MTTLLLDIETDGLNPTRIWCACAKVLGGAEYSFTEETGYDGLATLVAGSARVVMHNGIHFDRPVLKRLAGVDIPFDRVVDTLVYSRLFNAGLESHSLDAWGKRLGFPKGDHSEWDRFTPEMLEYCRNDTRVLERLYKFLAKKLHVPAFERALEIEHRMQLVALEMHTNGFAFDIANARAMSVELDNEVQTLLSRIQEDFKPRSKLIREINPTATKLGTLHRKDFKWYDGDDFTIFSVDAPFSLVEFVAFSPSSPTQVVDVLWKAGWNPVEKTKTHLLHEKDGTVTERDKIYGWKINERNLATLPDSAPPAAHLLIEYLLTIARQRTLKEWMQYTRVLIPIVSAGENTTTATKINDALVERLGPSEPGSKTTQPSKETPVSDENTASLRRTLIDWLKISDTSVPSVNELLPYVSIIATPQGRYVDCSALLAMENWGGLKCMPLPPGSISRIHGEFNPIGTRTQRCSHRRPNMGNVAAKKSIKYNSEHLKNKAIKYGGRMRSMWIAGAGHELVGIDMQSAHLRIFAHLINDPAFTESLISGDKKLGTDPHSLNQRALGTICPDRDRAKTFIFTYLNGGGGRKVSEIFACPLKRGTAALKQFEQAYPGLATLKEQRIPNDARRGYFEGTDGRLIVNDSEHHMIGMYLQSTESILMKYAIVWTLDELASLGIPAKLVNFVHDEMVFETPIGNGEIIGRIAAANITKAGEVFNLRCPLSGEAKVGANWLECH